MVNSNTCFKGANVHCRNIFTHKWFKCHGKYFRHIWFYIKQIMHACWQETSRDSGLGTPHMKGVGMLVVSLRGVNFRFCSHLGCHHIFWATPRSVSLVYFKISDEHPHPFHMRIPPPPGYPARFSKSWPHFRPKMSFFTLVFRSGGGHKTQHYMFT